MADIKFDKKYLQKDEHTAHAKELGLEDWAISRAELNDLRFKGIEKEIDTIKELRAKVDKLENNHIAHMGQDIYELGLEVAKLRKLIKGDV